MKQLHIVCINNAYVSQKALAGGDLFFIELARRAPKSVNLSVILPQTGYFHWQKLYPPIPGIRFNILSSGLSDDKDHPLLLLLVYLIRSLKTYVLLRKLTSFKYLYSATDIVSDVLPAYFFKKSYPRIRWVCRFFHFVDPPFSRQGNWWINTGAYLLQNMCIKLITSADLVMIDNPGLKEKLIQKGINPEKISYQPGGAEIKIFQNALPLNRLKSTALFIGRLQEHKGAPDALEIWEKVIQQHPQAKLVFIGFTSDGTDKQLLLKSQKRHLQNNISFTGYIRNRNLLARYLKSTRFLLFLDHEAGFGLVVVEAMAAGIPVVCYDLPIFKSVYRQGFVASSLKNTDQVADNINNLITYPKKYKRLSRLAKIQAREFDWKIVSKRFYKTLLVKK